MRGIAQLRWLPLLSAGAAALAVALIGASVTDLGPWYLSLHMPSWKPPDLLFGPAWMLIFATAALAAAYGWQALPHRLSRLILCAFFALNAILNVLWSLLFFRSQRPDWALLEVGLLWLSIALLIVLLARVSRRAAWLLVPYLLWVSYAAILNWAVVRLNPS
jgi:tryptophan-rich sensory protein